MLVAPLLILFVNVTLSIISVITRRYYLAGLFVAIASGVVITLTIHSTQKEIVYVKDSPETRSYNSQLEQLNLALEALHKSRENLSHKEGEISSLKKEIALFSSEEVAEVEMPQSVQEKPKLSSLLQKAFGLVDTYFYESTEFNFRIKIDSKTVVALPKSTIPADAQIGLRFKDCSVYSVILAENDEQRLIQTPEIHHDIVLSNIEARATRYKLLKTEKCETSEGTFLTSFCDFEHKNLSLYYAISTLYKNGRAYQILTWGTKEHRGAIQSKLKILRDSFEFTSPDLKLADTSDSTALADLSSPRLGVKIKLSKVQGSLLDNFTESYPSAHLGFSTATNDSVNSEVLIYLFDLDDLQLTQKSIDEGILYFDSISPSEKSLKKLEVTAFGDLNLRSYSYQSKDGSDVIWHTKLDITQKDNILCAVFCWSNSKKDIPNSSNIWKNFEWSARSNDIEATPQVLQDRAYLINRIGLASHTQEKYQVAQKCFKKAHQLSPKDDQYGINWTNAHTSAGEYTSGLTAINEVISISPSMQPAVIRKAEILIQLDQLDEGLNLYESAFSSGYKDDDCLLDFLNSLIDAKQYQRGVDFMQSYEKKYSSEKMKRWLASMLSSNGQYHDAIKILSQVIKESPTNSSAIELIADQYKYLKQYKTAHEWIKKLQATSPKDIDYQLLEAKLLRSEKKNKEAYAFLKNLTLKYPDHSETQRLFTVSSATLGLGDHRQLSEEIIAVPLPDEISQLVGIHTKHAHKEEADHSAYYHHDMTSIHCSEEGKYKQTRYIKFTVNTSRGVDDFKNWALNFDPVSEDLFVNKHIIYAPSGKIAHEGKTTEYHISDENSSLVTHQKELTIPNIGLEVGSTVELIYTKKTWYSSDSAFPFKQFWMQSPYPERFRSISVSGCDDKRNSHSSQPVEQIVGNGSHTWWNHHSHVYHRESYTPDIEKLLTRLSIGSDQLEWKDVSLKYYNHIEERFKIDSKLNAEIDRILKNHSTRPEKIKASIHWVQQFCKYRGLEFGPRGRMPKPALTTLEGREGDCKDMSLLLWHMLKRIGLSPQLALANTDGHIVTSLPDENQFNHIVLYCPELPNTSNSVIDPTYQHLNIFSTAPHTLVGYHILPISSEGADLVKVPATSSSSNEFMIERNVDMSATDLSITESIHVSGYAASYLRRNLSGINKLKQRKKLHSWFSSFYPNILISSFDIISGSDETSSPLHLKICYQYPKDLTRTYLPVPWERYYFETSQANNRVNAIECKVPTRFETSTNFTSKVGFEIISKPNESDFAKLQIKHGNSSIGIISQRKCSNAPASSYSKFQSQQNGLVPLIQLHPDK